MKYVQQEPRRTVIRKPQKKHNRDDSSLTFPIDKLSGITLFYFFKVQSITEGKDRYSNIKKCGCFKPVGWQVCVLSCQYLWVMEGNLKILTLHCTMTSIFIITWERNIFRNVLRSKSLISKVESNYIMSTQLWQKYHCQNSKIEKSNICKRN